MEMLLGYWWVYLIFSYGRCSLRGSTDDILAWLRYVGLGGSGRLVGIQFLHHHCTLVARSLDCTQGCTTECLAHLPCVDGVIASFGGPLSFSPVCPAGSAGIIGGTVHLGGTQILSQGVLGYPPPKSVASGATSVYLVACVSGF